MTRLEKVDSKEVGLEIGLLMARFFFNSEDLHFGYWPQGCPTGLSSIPEAQARHTDLIFSHIPVGIDKILDVGAGSGELAKKLVHKGYSVDCVSPSSFLSDTIQSKLPPESTLYRTTFEALQTDHRYDLIIFSESFQYVKIQPGLSQCEHLLNHNGHLLICDFFSLETGSKSPLRGGHKLSRFLETVEQFPFENITDLNITNETAPTIGILDKLLTEFLIPSKELSARYLISNFPTVTKLLRWKLKKRIAKINRVYMSGQITAASFIKHKSYRLFLYRKTSI
ncbi:MAG TPA: class I SAM-dependent methyltransferase [Candidatus Marinimicrobia bacterium]|nr:class I SAM-dependent methyltransferase [Candidatus Neomarinimicrobiota bacterium]HIO88125.1 class I SAM-dependent methyltransferase [Candidatus Neomarinimicrobiota bacterium]